MFTTQTVFALPNIKQCTEIVFSSSHHCCKNYSPPLKMVISVYGNVCEDFIEYQYVRLQHARHIANRHTVTSISLQHSHCYQSRLSQRAQARGCCRQQYQESRARAFAKRQHYSHVFGEHSMYQTSTSVLLTPDLPFTGHYRERDHVLGNSEASRSRILYSRLHYTKRVSRRKPDKTHSLASRFSWKSVPRQALSVRRRISPTRDK